MGVVRLWGPLDIDYHGTPVGGFLLVGHLRFGIVGPVLFAGKAAHKETAGQGNDPDRKKRGPHDLEFSGLIQFDL